MARRKVTGVSGDPPLNSILWRPGLRVGKLSRRSEPCKPSPVKKQQFFHILTLTNTLSINVQPVFGI
jgi:hypothetical protein